MGEEKPPEGGLDDLTDLTFEEMALGALLYNNALFDEVGHRLQSYHFADGFHRYAYERIVENLRAGKAVSFATITEPNSRERAHLQQCQMAQHTHAANISFYVDYLIDLHQRRELTWLADDLTHQVQDRQTDVAGLIDTTSAKLFSLIGVEGARDEARTLGTHAADSIADTKLAKESGGRHGGIPTTFRDLDAKIGGLRPGTITIIAGRPGMGKTAFLMNMLYRQARLQIRDGVEEGLGSLFFSLEMSGRDLAQRMLTLLTRIAPNAQQMGDIDDAQLKELEDYRQTALTDLPIYIDDRPRRSVDAIHARARHYKRTKSIGLVALDHIGFVRPEDSRAQRVHQLTQISADLLAVAKDLHLPVVILSQLSRAVENRDDKRPNLSDLRDSGSLEQDAHNVLFLYRDEYYQRKNLEIEARDRGLDVEGFVEAQLDHKIRNVCEVAIAKQRSGHAGMTTLYFNGAEMRFDDIDRRADLQYSWRNSYKD